MCVYCLRYSRGLIAVVVCMVIVRGSAYLLKHVVIEATFELAKRN